MTDSDPQEIVEHTWRNHLATGEILEDDLYGGYRMVGVEIIRQISMVQYKYRLLFFTIGGQVPILSVNLEQNTLFKEIGGGAYFLGVHSGTTHYNLGIAFDGRSEITYDEFRKVAWDIASLRIDLGENEEYD
jgi:hypothetical protein